MVGRYGRYAGAMLIFSVSYMYCRSKHTWLVGRYLYENVHQVKEVEQDGMVQLPQLLLPVHILAGVQLLNTLHQANKVIQVGINTTKTEPERSSYI